MEVQNNLLQFPLSNAELKKYKNIAEYKADVIMGQKSEHQTLQVIQMLLDDVSLKKCPGKYAVLDFYSKRFRTKCEVKGRRNTKDAFATTMLGANKTKEAEALSKKGYTILFFFDFQDGLYYFDYKDWETITSMDKYECKMGGTYRRGLREWKLYNYIPVSALIKCEFGTGSINYTKTKRVFKKRKKENKKV